MEPRNIKDADVFTEEVEAMPWCPDEAEEMAFEDGLAWE